MFINKNYNLNLSRYLIKTIRLIKLFANLCDLQNLQKNSAIYKDDNNSSKSKAFHRTRAPQISQRRNNALRSLLSIQDSRGLFRSTQQRAKEWQVLHRDVLNSRVSRFTHSTLCGWVSGLFVKWLITLVPPDNSELALP